MKNIFLLKNKIQNYAWGSFTYIGKLLNEKIPTDKPEAELWMGAHPKAPSMIKVDDKYISLLELINKNPETLLGKKAAKKFNNRLPFLFKILACKKPLSIQAHPSLKQAAIGFKAENEKKILKDAPKRNYKDDNHKPECICALTEFWALKDFRKIDVIVNLLNEICPIGLIDEISYLKDNQNQKGLKHFFNLIMNLNNQKKENVVCEASANAQKMFNEKKYENKEVYYWILNLNNDYPNDIGILAPAILNIVCLKPGQALFIPEAQLHSYLEGVGIELMANSDNVLRGGLTPKHVDIDELLNVLNFNGNEVNILAPEKVSDTESKYQTNAKEFELSVIKVNSSNTYLSQKEKNIEILICIKGNAIIKQINSNDKINLDKGVSVVVFATASEYEIFGDATIYKASVPI